MLCIALLQNINKTLIKKMLLQQPERRMSLQLMSVLNFETPTLLY